MSVAYIFDRNPRGCFSLTDAVVDCDRRVRAVLPHIECHATPAEVFDAMLNDSARLWVFKSVHRNTQPRKPATLFEAVA